MTLRLKIYGSVRRIMLVIVVVLVVANTPQTKYVNNHTYRVQNVGERIVLILSGLYETEEQYKIIEGYFTDAGITPIFIDMDWRITRIFNFIEHGSREIEKAVSLYPQ